MERQSGIDGCLRHQPQCATAAHARQAPTHLVRQHDDGLLPHHAALLVAHVVNLVEDHLQAHAAVMVEMATRCR